MEIWYLSRCTFLLRQKINSWITKTRCYRVYNWPKITLISRIPNLGECYQQSGQNNKFQKWLEFERYSPFSWSGKSIESIGQSTFVCSAKHWTAFEVSSSFAAAASFERLLKEKWFERLISFACLDFRIPRHRLHGFRKRNQNLLVFTDALSALSVGDRERLALKNWHHH
jgi:hypothetical protein